MHDEAATKNNCFLCSLNGREPDNCRIAVPDIHPRQFINGHSARRRSVICKWFDATFPEGNAERELRIEGAKRARATAPRSVGT